jgi:hypothetical protein
MRAGRREPEEVHIVLAEASSRIRSEEALATVLPALEEEASLAIERCDFAPSSVNSWWRSATHDGESSKRRSRTAPTEREPP